MSRRQTVLTKREDVLRALGLAPDHQETVGDGYPRISADLWRQVQAQAERRDVSPRAYVEAAIQAQLRRHSGPRHVRDAEKSR